MQILALESGNNRLTVRQEIYDLATKFYSELYKAPPVLKGETTTPQGENVPVALFDVVKMALQDPKSGK